jgi:putative nucleotidyltransferase with HDIG domain
VKRESSKFSAFFNIAGLVIFLVAFLIAIKAYTTFFVYRYVKIENLFILFNAVLIFQIILMKGSFYVIESLGTHFLLNPFNQVESYFYALPFAAGPVLLTSLSNQLIAIILAVSLGGFTGIMTDGNFYIALFSIVSSLAGIYGIRHYRERSAFIKASMIVSLVNVIYITAINLITGEFEPVVLFFEVFLGFISGFLIAFFASFLAPLLESAFGIATDIKLLELSSADRELLRQLTIEAPGTYQHSVMVGILAEAGAAEIRANSLFCRVAALYHDIGKLAKPDYFVENNQNAPKLHRKQKPHMSALIIVNHVKKGIQMAKEHKIPQTIIDIIPQHHGTRLIGSFYQLAKEQSDPTIEVINEEDFRYPGPKPQTKEAAMIMIADTAEAATRTIENPTPHKIRFAVEDLVNNIFLDGQLDECQLTFIELRRSTEAIIKKITTIFHSRIEYPQFQFNKASDDGKGAIPQSVKSS